MKVSWIGLVSALVVFPAFAGFTVVKPTPPPAPGVKVQPAPLNLVATRLIGVPAGVIPVRMGFGHQVTLAEALQQIAPPGWHANLLPSMVGHFDRNEKVDWEGGRPWPEVLDILVNDEGLSAEVDWYQHLILIGDRSERPHTPTTLAAAQPKPVKPPPPPPNPATQVYVIPAGTRLSVGMAKYVARFGWQVRWNVSEDQVLDAPFPIPAGDVTEGVKYVLNAYHAQGVLLGVTQRFARPNHIVDILPLRPESRL